MLKYVNFQILVMRINCPECGSDKFETHLKEVSCKKCGLVVMEGMIMSH